MALPRSLYRRSRTRAARSIDDAPYMAALIAAAVTLTLTLTVPAGLVLPVLSVVLLALAFSIAAASQWRRSAAGSPAWYVSAALTFLGFGAAFLTEPEQVLPLFESGRRAP